MKIYILLVLLFLTINQSIAQPVRFSKNNIPPTTNISENTLILTLVAFLEGYTNSEGTTMRNDHYPITITVELHNSNIPYDLVEAKTGVLSSTGVGMFTFTAALNSIPYYIVVKSANTIETWSATAHNFTSGSLNYNFSTSAEQAYGSNMIKKGSTWCFYSGDVAKDNTNIVDGSDLIAVDNDNTYSNSNPITDLNGDGIVDGSDLINVDNNNTYAITCSVPTGTPPISLDYEGQTYHIVQIGTQYWLRENLNVGTRIDGGLDQTGVGPGNINKYCYMDNDDNCNIYGGLYQWNEAMQFSTTEKAQGICPNDWHIPTLSEFNTLINTVNNDNLALIEIGQGNGTNTSGFSALTEPYFLYFSSDFWMFYDGDNSSNFWSSTSTVTSEAYEMYFYDASSAINLTSMGNKYGFAVRCVKN